MPRNESKYVAYREFIESMYSTGASLRRICAALAEAGCVKPDYSGLNQWIAAQTRLKAKVQKRARQLAAGADGTSDVLDPVLKATADALLAELRKNEGLVVSRQKPKKVEVSSQASTVVKRPGPLTGLANLQIEEEAAWAKHAKHLKR